jgi:HSP20 family protein
MRYRRLSYRYAVVTAKQPFSVMDTRPAEPLGFRFAQAFWRPPADICESEQAIEVTVDLAGVDQDELDVILYEDAVVVSGQRRLSPLRRDSVFFMAEIRQGPFLLELPLPAAFDQEKVDARYDRGLLRMTFQKVPAKARSVS